MAYYGSNPDYNVQPGYLADQVNLAGFWIRVGATLIDGLILLIPSIILRAIASTVGGTILTTGLDGIYCIAFWVANGGRTIGDVALGLRVVREDSSPITLGIGLVRFIMLVIGSYALLLGILWVIWDENKQGWHDKAAGTLVVRV